LVLSTHPLSHPGAGEAPPLQGPGGEFFVHERPHPLPRAFTVPAVRLFDADDAVVTALADPSFAPGAAALALAADVPEPLPPAGGGAPRDVRFTTDHPTVVELDIEAGDAPWLVLADTWLPGWRATVDGTETPVLRADHSLRMVRLPAGPCRVRFDYTCPGLGPGLWLATIAALALIALALRERLRRV
jgi:hypothetical protein